MGIIIVDEVPYKSKADLKRKTTSIITQMIEKKYVKILPGSEYFSFWLSLFKRNPDKGHLFPSSFTFEAPYHMYYNTDTKIKGSFGYNYCINQIKSTKKSDFIQCLRSTIEPQIKSFRQISLHQPCSICFIHHDKYEIDHKIPFKNLYDNFTKTVDNIDLSMIKTQNKNRRLLFDLENEYTKSLHDLWEEYHLNFATLQKLCLECHKNKS